MLEPDADTRRMLVRERQAVLTRDAWADTPMVDALESRIARSRRTIGLSHLRFQRATDPEAAKPNPSIQRRRRAWARRVTPLRMRSR
jgi:hypothetical protein